MLATAQNEICIRGSTDLTLFYYKIENAEKPKTPLRGLLAKQNRVGYASIDVVAKVYSHSFTGIIAKRIGFYQAAVKHSLLKRITRF